MSKALEAARAYLDAFKDVAKYQTALVDVLLVDPKASANLELIATMAELNAIAHYAEQSLEGLTSEMAVAAARCLGRCRVEAAINAGFDSVIAECGCVGCVAERASVGQAASAIVSASGRPGR